MKEFLWFTIDDAVQLSRVTAERVTLLADLIYIMLQIGYWIRDSWAKYFIALGYNLPSLFY